MGYAEMGEVSIADFQKLDIRVGRVESAERIPGKTKVLKVNVNLGDEIRTVIAGGGEIYPPEYFAGRSVVVLVNLEPKRIAGVESKGMLLAADIVGRPYWLTVDREVPAGSKVR